ncbi:DUF898 family protein [Ramlibacter ginsenosidimutans]|uniref:DUF898 family protein n=1 Tax=Ramlibacter ginsenosidimutans TaxID=502333 RepID=A0A934TV94_9BURK|nr:DUF898 family protein [Ramlibacter ginsenosidimutans]MBK6008232.1 DUF898 family protein [Ramlibacter ginsenosidimutans]
MGDGHHAPARDSATTPHALTVAFTGRADEVRARWRRDLWINLVLGGLYTPVARRHVALYLASRTLVDGEPVEAVPVRKSPWPAIVLVALYIAARVAQEFDHGPPLPLVVIAGVLLLPYVWGVAVGRSVDALRWRGMDCRFSPGWRRIYAESWPLLLLGCAWAPWAPLVADAADRPETLRLDATALSLIVAAVVLALGLLLRLGFQWQRLRITGTRVGGHAVQWDGRFAEYARIWAGTAAAVALTAVLPVVLVRHALLGSFTLQGLDPERAAIAWTAGILLVWILSVPARAWHAARLFRFAWSGVRVGGIARVDCALDVRRHARLRAVNAWRTLLTAGARRAEAVLQDYRAKLASLRVEELAGGFPARHPPAPPL